jgi:hypothetical protein
MPEPRAKSDGDWPRASRTRRGDAALVAQYIHELSERHDVSGPSRGAADGAPARDGLGREDGG